jgi:hypothetical protein
VKAFDQRGVGVNALGINLRVIGPNSCIPFPFTSGMVRKLGGFAKSTCVNDLAGVEILLI